MQQRYSRLLVCSFLVCIFLAVSAHAYEILLDIDIDNDPSTINISTEETSAIVKIILWPTTADETIGFVAFGVGGECLACPPDPSGVQAYGVSFDLPFEGSWVTAPGFDSEAAYMTLLGCPGNPGFHLLLSFEPEGGGTMILSEPMFLAEFNAWVSPPVTEPCPQPMPILMAMPGQGEYYNYIVLDGAEGPNSVEVSTWGRIKGIYR